MQKRDHVKSMFKSCRLLGVNWYINIHGRSGGSVEMAVVDVTVAVVYLKHLLNSSPVQFHCKMAQPYHISSLEIPLESHCHITNGRPKGSTRIPLFLERAHRRRIHDIRM